MNHRNQRDVVEVRELYRAAMRRYGASGSPQAREDWVDAGKQLAVVVNKVRSR